MIQEGVFHIEAEEGRIIQGTRRADVLHGTTDDDIIHGFGRGDCIFSSGGRDYIDGGRGYDIVSYSQMTPSIQLALNGSRNAFVYVQDPARAAAFYADHEALAAEKEAIFHLLYSGGMKAFTHLPKFIPGYFLKDIVHNIEGVIGGHGHDLLIGDKRGNFLMGGPGQDILVGGAGADEFLYSIDDVSPSPLGKVDAILDFHPQEGDRINLSDLSYELEEPLTFAWATSSYVSSVPYSVFYKKGIAPNDNPLYGDPRFTDATGEPAYTGENGLSLMVDLDGDAHADFMIAVWGADHITASDLIL